MNTIDECKVINQTFKWEPKDKGHSDVEVILQGECSTSLEGKTWTLNLFDQMKHLKNVELKALGKDKQVSERFNKPSTILFSL